MRPLSDSKHKAFRGWGTQGQLSLRDMSLRDTKILERDTHGQLSFRDMSLSDNKILERGTQGILSLRNMFLSDNKILERGTQLWSNSWGHALN